MSHTKAAKPSPQYGKLYWDIDAPLVVRAVLARVEYRCYSAADGFRPTEIIEADFEQALGLGRTATRAAIEQALALKLISRARSTRGDGRGVFVYLPCTRSESEPVTSAIRTRRVRKSDRTRSESEPDGFANQPGEVRGSDISDPTVEPVEPEIEPSVEPGEIMSAKRGPLAESPNELGQREQRAEPLTLLGLEAPARDIAAELLAEHDRVRRLALEAHGLRITALRRAGTSAAGKTLRLIRARLDEHDEETCRHVLAVLAADWMRDDSQFRPRDWTCEDAIWSTNFDRHRVREVGSAFGGKRAPRDNGLNNLAGADDFAAMQRELDARNHRA